MITKIILQRIYNLAVSDSNLGSQPFRVKLPLITLKIIPFIEYYKLLRIRIKIK